ncbi:MAG: iron-sulfur cluster carrier protein ApbC [Phototrophicales bacterium]|nr:MAG: iron-sulfur cluster carrier protein ApbC [Phototrophicales bacterium]
MSEQEIKQAIENYIDPYLNKSLYALKAVKSLQVQEGKVVVEIEMPYACKGLHGAIEQILRSNIEFIEGISQVDVSVNQAIHSHKVQGQLCPFDRVKNVIAVASGKGGVGKSTNAVNLALALSQEGAKVGILDADIYGPSIGMMLGIEQGQSPEVEDEKYFLPIQAHGIEAMSMAFLVDPNTPMVWRGPKVSGALLQLATQTLWDHLDYLIVDMPPGTGDIQLTLAQRIPVTGAVIVTTPQDIALLDCQKGIEMFRKVGIDVLGVIENMSTHICSQCGHHEPVFGHGGGERIASQYQTEVLAQMPLVSTIREQTDSGTPTVVAEPDCEVAHLYRDMARKVSAIVSQRPRDPRRGLNTIAVSQE